MIVIYATPIAFSHSTRAVRLKLRGIVRLPYLATLTTSLGFVAMSGRKLGSYTPVEGTDALENRCMRRRLLG